MQINFENKYKKLLEIEHKFYDLTIQGEAVWPYFRNKIYGALHRESNQHQSNSYIPSFNPMTFKKSQQLSSIEGEVDALVFVFNRMVEKEYGILDEKTNYIYEQLKAQKKKVLRVIHNEEGIHRLTGEDVYRTDDVRIAYEKRLIPYYFYPDEQKRLYEMQNEVVNDLQINFSVHQYFDEIGSKVTTYHSYYRNVFEKLKPKVIFVTSNYMRQEMMIPAKEMGIPVYDIQYAAFTNCHSGYHLPNDYPFFPNGLLIWSEFWNRKEVFPQDLQYDIKVVGLEGYKHREQHVDKKKDQVVFISQNFIAKFIQQQAVAFAKAYPEYTVILKLHPNDNLPNEDFPSNLKVIKKTNLNLLIEESEYLIGVGSTVLFEGIQAKCKVVILDNYLNAFMKNMKGSPNVFFVHELVDEFPTIKQTELLDLPWNIYEEVKEIKFDELNLRNNELLNIRPKTFSLQELNLKIDTMTDAIESEEDFSLFDKNKPLLSIIVPCYNAESSLERLMNSIIRQSVFKYSEVILVNDGSNDQTKQMIESYVKHYKNVYLIDNDLPSGSATRPRNQALDRAIGEYVYFLDSDDYLYRQELDFVFYKVLIFKADVAKCSTFVDKGGTYYKWMMPKKVTTAKLFVEMPQFLSSTFLHNHIYKRAIIEEQRLRVKHVPIGEDLIFNLEFYNKMEKVLLFDRSLNVYHKEDETLSGKIDNERMLIMLKSLTDNYVALKKAYPGNIELHKRYVKLLIIRNLFLNDIVYHNFERIFTKEVCSMIEKAYDSFVSSIPPYQRNRHGFTSEGLYQWISTLRNEQHVNQLIDTSIEFETETISVKLNVNDEITVYECDMRTKDKEVITLEQRITKFKKVRYNTMRSSYHIEYDGDKNIVVRKTKNRLPKFGIHTFDDESGKIKVLISSLYFNQSDTEKYYFKGNVITRFSNLFEIEENETILIVDQYDEVVPFLYSTQSQKFLNLINPMHIKMRKLNGIYISETTDEVLFKYWFAPRTQQVYSAVNQERVTNQNQVLSFYKEDLNRFVLVDVANINSKDAPPSISENYVGFVNQDKLCIASRQWLKQLASILTITDNGKELVVEAEEQELLDVVLASDKRLRRNEADQMKRQQLLLSFTDNTIFLSPYNSPVLYYIVKEKGLRSSRKLKFKVTEMTDGLKIIKQARLIVRVERKLSNFKKK